MFQVSPELISLLRANTKTSSNNIWFSRAFYFYEYDFVAAFSLNKIGFDGIRSQSPQIILVHLKTLLLHEVFPHSSLNAGTTSIVKNLYMFFLNFMLLDLILPSCQCSNVAFTRSWISKAPVYVFSDKEPEKAFVFLSWKLGQLKTNKKKKKEKKSQTLFQQQLTPAFVYHLPLPTIGVCDKYRNFSSRFSKILFVLLWVPTTSAEGEVMESSL